MAECSRLQQSRGPDIRTDYELPKDARTLMKISTSIGQEIEEVAGGEYWFKGIEKVLRNYFR